MAESKPRRDSSRFPWRWAAIGLAGLAALAGIGVLIALNWEPEMKLGEVSGPDLDSELALGGLASDDLGMDVMLDSLESVQPVGYRIVSDAVDENVINDVKQVPPSGNWTSEYRLNDGALRLRVRANKEFILNYPIAEEETSNEFFAIARRYGFYSSPILATLRELEDRTTALLDEFDARPLTQGIPESDLASEASTLASDWDAWINSYGDNPLEADVADAQRDVVLVVSEVASNPTDAGLDEYNAAIGTLNRAVGEYNDSL